MDNLFDCNNPNSLELGPDGLFLPFSHASTVLVDTPNHLANIPWVNPVLLQIFLISAAV